MKKQALGKFVDLVISEDHERASEAIRQWIVESTKQIYESMIHEDDMEDHDLTDEIAFARDTIEAEENLAEDEFGNEEAETEETGEGAIEDRVFDLETQLGELRAKLAEIQAGDEMDDFGDEAGTDDVDGVEDDEMTVDTDMDDGEEETDPAFKTESEEMDDEDKLDESEEELEEDFDDLEESFNLETVKVSAQDKEGALVGDSGKETVHAVSPIPQKKLGDRMGGEPVKIKAKEHKGFDREAAPAVKDRPLLKNQVNNASNGMSEKVAPEGDKAAVLNKKDGFGTDSPKSIISGAKGAKNISESKK